jgi:hypothetical protein
MEDKLTNLDLDRLIKLVSENPNYQSTKISNEIQSLKGAVALTVENYACCLSVDDAKYV